MQYGLLFNKNAANLGDDIQSYAISQFMPRIDLLVNREKMDTFKFGDGTEPVSLVFAAWFMWHKYRWPPARQIIPLLVGFHNFDRADIIDDIGTYTLPIYSDSQFSGIGGQWMKDYGPVGCRDYYTQKVLMDMGIENYFSGCITLTLPHQPETPDKGTYVVLVDLAPEVEKKVRSLIGNCYEIRKLSQTVPELKTMTWDERKATVEKYLTIYQNAKYVVTRRLHVALPCLAMETPVMVIQGVKMNDANRFDPYRNWLHYYRNNDFIERDYKGFDFINGTPNKNDYKRTREELIKRVKDFYAYCQENEDKPLEFFDKRSFTEKQMLKWRVNFMSKALFKTHEESKRIYGLYLNAKKAKKLAEAKASAQTAASEESTAPAAAGVSAETKVPDAVETPAVYEDPNV